MIKVLKFLVAFAASMFGGLLVGAGIAVATNDITFAQFFEKLLRLGAWEVVGVPLIGILFAGIAFMLVVLLHEAGHLVCGLLTGYEFVSFRVLNYTFIKANGKLQIKRFAVAGTGGQCLLLPPDLPVEDVPTGWYNFGGILANLLLLAVVAPILFVVENPFVRMFLVMLAVIDILMLLLNGIPMQAGGLSNDAGNILMLRRNHRAKRALVAQLKSNALLQSGMRPKDMPDELFVVPSEIDYKNPLEVSLPIMRASRLLDKGEIEPAYESFSELMDRKSEIMGLYVKEIACELAYTAMLTGHIEQARELLNKDLMRYVVAYRSVMSSKERLLCAKALYLDSNPEEARRIYRNLQKRQSDYLLQGEVASDLALMERMLRE